jgi:hypothetical protein
MLPFALALAVMTAPAAAQPPGIPPGGQGGGPEPPEVARQQAVEQILNNREAQQLPPLPPDLSKMPEFGKRSRPIHLEPPPRKPAELPSWLRWEYAPALFVVSLIGGLLWGRYGPYP